MSRAFMKENDGLARCIERKEECLYADGNGHCRFERCVKEAETERRKKVRNLRITRPDQTG